MAQQFEVQALGLNGIPYRIEIYNENYGGTTVTQLNGDQQFIRFEGGQRERVGIEPIWGKEVRINVRTNEDLSPLFGLEDRDAEVRVFRTDTSSLVWKGFILTDFFQDEPRTALPGVELRAVDGLTTLEGDSFDALSGVSDSDIGEDGSFISYTDLFTGVLSTLYDSPLDVEFAVEWYPDAGGQLTSSDNPLRYSGARPDVYYNSEDGAWFDQQSALEDALKSQGLEVRQAVIGGGLTWLVAQPTALSASSVKTWRYAPGGTEDASSPFTRDLSLDLSSADTNRPTREFERRSESVSVTHDHTPIENLVGDDGYEEIGIGNASGWQIDNAATSYIDASILNHDNADASSVGEPDPTPSSLQQDTYVLEVRGSSQNNAVEYPISQDLGDISGIPSETALKFSHQLWHEPFEQQPSNGDQPHLYAELEIGGFYLTEFEAGVRQGVKGGSGTLPVQSLDRAIPNGTKLPLYNRTDSPPDQIPRAFITLSERADKGDTVLVGDISRDVDSKWSVAYLGFTSTAYDFALWRWAKNPNSWGRVEARAFAKDPNGQPLSGNATLRIGGAALYGETNAGSVVDRPAFVDDVTVQLTQEGNELTATTKEGTVSENGQSRDLSVLLSSGPTNKNARRVKGLAPGGSSYQAVDWGIGAGGGSLSLAGLQARERLRYLREHLERQQLTVYARDKSPVVTGEEIVQFDGKTWRIAEFSSDPASGEIGLTLIQHADAGTTDLSIATVRDTEDGGTSGGGGGTAPAVGGGGGVSTWDDLSDKPSVLTPPGFSAGNFPSAEQLASADIASALNHDPGLSGDIQTTVRASATDDALITEQAVADEIQSAQGDTKRVARRLVQTQADIDALDAVTVRRSRELIAGQGIETLGDLSEDRTVAVDSTVARTDRDETFTGSVTIEEDLLVQGDEVVQNVETVEIQDHLQFLNAGETGSGVLAGEFGIEGDRGSDPPVKLKYAEATNAARVGVDYKALNHTGANFQFNETVVGQSSGAEGIVWQNSSGTARVKGRTGSFASGETIVGQQSGASASINSITEVDQTQALATRQDKPEPAGVPFWNDSLTRFDTDATLTYDGDRVRSTGYQSGSSFVPGFSGSGYAVDETIDGKPDAMHLSHLDVRGTLTVRELILKQISVEKGPNIISPGGGKVEDISTSSHTAAGNTFSSTTQQEWSFTDQTDDPLKHGLAQGDRLLAQRFDPDSQTVVAQVRAVVDVVPDPTTVKVTLDASFTTPNTGKDLEGYAFAVVASSDPGRDSLIYQTPYGPYDDYLDGLSDFNDWDNRADKIKVRAGNIENASTAIDAGTHGLYGESVRLTEDIIAGDIAAAKAPDTTAGDFFRYDSNGLFLRVGGTKIRAMQDDIKLLAERIVQERESRAGLELTASETEARFEADVKFAGNTASISLVANDDGSSARLAGDSITLDADTIITGSLTMDNTNDPNGEITNSAGDFTLDENGLTLDVAPNGYQPNQAISFTDGNGDEKVGMYFTGNQLEISQDFSSGVYGLDLGFELVTISNDLGVNGYVQAGDPDQSGIFRVTDDPLAEFRDGFSHVIGATQDRSDSSDQFIGYEHTSKSGKASLFAHSQALIEFLTSENTGPEDDPIDFEKSFTADDSLVRMGPIAIYNDYYNIGQSLPPALSENKTAALFLTNRGSGVELVARFRDSNGNVSTKQLAIS